jgi:hypothetical protein
MLRATGIGRPRLRRQRSTAHHARGVERTSGAWLTAATAEQITRLARRDAAAHAHALPGELQGAATAEPLVATDAGAARRCAALAIAAKISGAVVMRPTRSTGRRATRGSKAVRVARRALFRDEIAAGALSALLQPCTRRARRHQITATGAALEPSVRRRQAASVGPAAVCRALARLAAHARLTQQAAWTLVIAAAGSVRLQRRCGYG